VQLGDISHLPFHAAAFDRVFTINTIYLWPDTLQGLTEIRRVLKDGGLAAVSLRSKEKMQRHGVTDYDFHLFSKDEVADLMRKVGFPRDPPPQLAGDFGHCIRGGTCVERVATYCP
jgi:ubiquinone/menaquinone biosynthesis C-methylase UbiE